MKILDRYIGMAVTISSLFAIAVLSFVLVLGNIFKRLLDLLVNHDVPLEFILNFIAYVLPFSLSFTIPWGFLTAILLVFGRLSAENELTAMRAVGISIPRIAAPVLLLSVFFGLVCLYINVDIAPRAMLKMRTAIYEMATNNPISLFNSDQVIEEFPGKKIYVGAKDGKNLSNIFIYDINEYNIPIRVTHARAGKLETRIGEGENAIPEVRMLLFDAQFEQVDENAPRTVNRMRHGITMNEGVLAISLEDLQKKNQKQKRLGSMTLEELDRQIASESFKNKENGELISAMRTEINKRFSFSFACIAFALIAVPFGITAQRKETSIGFAFSIVIAFVYFLFIIVADTFRENAAAYPQYLVWIPNVLFIGLGLFLFWKLSKK